MGGAFDDLSNAGVHVRTYSSDASPYIHAKVVVADHATLFLGSQKLLDRQPGLQP